MEKYVIKQKTETEHQLSEKHQAAIHRAGIGIWSYDLMKNHFSYPDILNEWLITAPPEITRGFLKRSLHAADAPEVQSNWDAALKGYGYDMSYRLLMNGEVINLRETCTPSFSENGKLQYLTGIFQKLPESREHTDSDFNEMLSASKAAEYSQTLLNIILSKQTFIDDLLTFSLNELMRLTQSRLAYLKVFHETGLRHSSPDKAEILVSVYDNKPYDYTRFAANRIDTAVRTGHAAFTDFRGHPQVVGDGVVVNRLITVPFIEDNQIKMVLELADKPAFYSQVDVVLIQNVMAVMRESLGRIDMLKALGETQEKVQMSERIRSAFLQNISHEIRTPMNAINGFAELLMMENSYNEERKQQFYSIILKNSKQLLSIINDVLIISSVDSKQEKLYIEPIDIREVMGELVSVLGTQPKNKNIEFRKQCELSGEDFHVLTDKIKLTQVLSNILHNALKFTDSGCITIGCRRENNYLLFYVSDTGIGIPADETSRIYDRFYQVEDAANREYDGTGLGLAICREFVKILKGELLLESTPGEGSTFTVKIPYMPHEGIGTQNSIHSPEADKAVKILIAEDDSSAVQLMEVMLEGSGSTVLYAENGKEAVELFKANADIDLVLMDIKMPEMQGHVAAGIIKQINNKVPIIAQTAYALSSEIQRYHNYFDDYLTKPIKRESLNRILTEYLKPDKFHRS